MQLQLLISLFNKDRQYNSLMFHQHIHMLKLNNYKISLSNKFKLMI